MEKINLFFIVFVVVVGLVILSLIPSNLIGHISGLIIGDTYWEDLEMYDCVQAGRWDKEYQNYKLTQCPDDRPVMKGVGIAVTDDAQSGGRAYCCKAENLEVYDCTEILKESNVKDYIVAGCPGDRQIMKGVGVKVKNDRQAGIKLYCCKGRDVELYSCAITSYWKESNEDNKLNFCPEDRQILSGAGFNINGDHQAGGKLRCCKGKVELEEVEEEEKTEEILIEEPEIEPEVEEDEETFKMILIKFLCKIRYLRNYDKYGTCVYNLN